MLDCTEYQEILDLVEVKVVEYGTRFYAIVAAWVVGGNVAWLVIAGGLLILAAWSKIPLHSTKKIKCLDICDHQAPSKFDF